jgi:enamine deaminase RidA (YjgF/YER057c/UK114 family)
VEQHGGTMNDIVKLGYFIKDLERIDEVRLVRDKFINQEHPPASTLVEIKSLFRPEFLIEIEATAIIPKL